MIRLTKKQTKLFRLLSDNNKRRYLIEGSARAGKTLTIACWILSEVARVPALKVLCLRKYRSHIKTTLFEQTFKPLVSGRKEFTIEESSLTIRHQNGSTIRFDGLDTQERVDKVLGSEYGIIYLNEATELDYKAVKVVMSRLAQNLPELQKRTLIMDCNPKSQFHWLYRLAIQGIDPESGNPIPDRAIWVRVSFKSTDNPYLPSDTLESLQALSGTERKRLWEGIWVSSEGLVYPEFTLDMIRHRDTTTAIAYLIGIDAGWSPDATVVALLAVLEDKGVKSLHLCGLHYELGKDMSQSIGDVCEQWRGLSPTIAVDPSASPAVIELSARGFNANPGQNRLKPGITQVRDLIKTGRLTAEPEFGDRLIEEITQYELDPRTELPKDGTPDHLLSAIRYAAMDFATIGGAESFGVY